MPERSGSSNGGYGNLVLWVSLVLISVAIRIHYALRQRQELKERRQVLAERQKARKEGLPLPKYREEEGSPPEFTLEDQDNPQAVFAVVPEAMAELKRGNFEAAERILHLQSERIGKLLGKHHSFYALALESEGALQFRLGNIESAIRLLRQAISILGYIQDQEKICSDFMISLSNILSLAGNYEEAEDTLRACLAVRQRIYEDRHAGVIEVYRCLARVIALSERPQEAREMLDKALAPDLANRTAQLAEDLALLAYILHLEKVDLGGLFPHWETVRRYNRVTPLCESVLALTTQFPERSSLEVLKAFRELIKNDPKQAKNLETVLMVSEHLASQTAVG